VSADSTSALNTARRPGGFGSSGPPYECAVNCALSYFEDNPTLADAKLASERFAAPFVDKADLMGAKPLDGKIAVGREEDGRISKQKV
jgi:hypothetical protein